MSIGSDKSSSRQSSSGSVWGEQSPYLTDLYSQAQGQLPAQEPYTQAAQKQYWNTAADLQQNYESARTGFEGALGQESPYAQAGADAAGMLSGVMTGDPVNNPYLQGNVQNAMDQITQNMQRNVLPSVRSGAQGAGQYGGSRQGIAEGLAMSDANRQASDVAGQMYGQAYEQGMTNKLAASGQAQGLLGQGTATGLSQLQGYGQLANLGMMPGAAYEQAGQIGYNALDRYAGLIGSPTVLTDTASRQGSSGWNFGL